ncbi:uncharacterized protein GEFmeso [Hetaerina americana]|uniref:uncharacterized protein GEFmeso n=1 Tax=Hetaerina americana TaxID=62018 RepID=UPI003A7F12DF
MVWGARGSSRGGSHGNSSTSDLVPTLLGMYDALIGRADNPVERPSEHQHQPKRLVDPGSAPPEGPRRLLPPEVGPGCGERPLSVTSIASFCSSSSSSSSGGGEGVAGRSKSCAYLASVESLGDDELSPCEDEEEKGAGQRVPGGRRGPDAQEGAGGSAEGAAFARGGRNPRTLHASSYRQQSTRRLFAAASSSSGVSSSSSSSATCSHISAPSLPTGPKPRYCDPNLSYMDRVVMEIAETEAIYVRDLQQVIEGYLHRWRSSQDCPIEPEQLKDLFSNIEDIYLFNSEFLCELERCGLDPVKVAKTFVRNNAGFSIYTEYCTNYPRTVSVLTELMRQDMTVRLFRERQGALQHTLPLGSYLLKPVQRILKYHLLLQNIVKHFGKESEGYRDIEDALSAMTGIAHHINEMKRRHEHAIRVQEIQSLLYGWEGEDLTTFGELCAEGAFRMHGAKALRHAFLFDRMLLLTKRKEEGMLIYKAHILCSNLMLIESVPGEPLSFHVIPFDNPRLQYTLQARNLEQKREWTLQLKRVILENYNAVIPTHARQLVMELGQNRSDVEIMAEKSTPKRQHSAPEYLERRKQERRKSETGLLLRNRLRRSNRKDSSAAMTDGMSSKEHSPAVHRRGRRAQSVSQDRSGSYSCVGTNREHQETLPSTVEKVKDRFGSWRRKSEPSYSPKSSTSIGHLSIYVSPDFIERSTDSLIDEPRKDEISISQNEKMCEGDGQDDQLMKKINYLEYNQPSRQSDCSKGEHSGNEECRQESLEEIVGQLVMQSHQFQKMLMRQHRRIQSGSPSRSRHHPRAEKDSCGESHGDHGSPEALLPRGEGLTPRLPSAANMFRAQRQAHMHALRQEQRLSSISHHRDIEGEEPSQIIAEDYMSLTLSNGKTASCVQENENCLEHLFNIDSSNLPRSNNGHMGNYDNLQNVWESVRQAKKEYKGAVTPMDSQHSKGEPSLWSSPSCLEACIPTLPAVWLKQQESHLATPSLKSGSLPRGFQLGQPSPGQPSHRHGALESASPLSPAINGINDEGCPSSTFRMERPFTIASESPGRADEIDFEDIEQYMAETGRRGGGSSFLPPRFPLSPLIGSRPEEEEDEEEEEDSSTASHIHVHPDYRIYRPSMSRATLKHVISSVSSRLANLRISASSVTTEDEEDGEEGHHGGQRRIGSSCPNSLDSNHIYGSRLSGGLPSGGDSEPEAGRGGSWLVYSLARHYSRSLKERIRSIMTMNLVGGTSSVNLDHDPPESPRGGRDSDCHSSDQFISQDNLNQTLNRSSPSKSSTPPVTYHKQGSSSLGARIAHGGEVPDYATPHIHGVGEKVVDIKEDISSRPDSLLSATSSACTSSSDSDNKTLSCPQDSSSVQSEQTGTCSTVMSAEEDEEDDYGGGSGDSYYEKSFEAIESFLSDPSMGCTIVGDAFRDSAIFSDHEEVEVMIGRASGDPSKVTLLEPPPSRVTSSLRPRIPPPVPAKPTACSMALAGLPHPSAPQVTPQGPSLLPLQLQGVKSVRERRQELEMWRSSLDMSGDSITVVRCEGAGQRVREDITLEGTEGGATPKGWVRHVIGKLQGD